MNPLSHLSTKPGIRERKDELNRYEKDVERAKIKQAKQAIKDAEAELRRLRKEEAPHRVSAFIDSEDVIMIIEDLLVTRSPVRKAFDRHEQKRGLCAEWASRTIRYEPDKLQLEKALDHLLKDKRNTSLALMDRHSTLDVKSLIKSSTYSEALNKLKRQFELALRFQDKDDLIAAKDIAISNKNRELASLNEALLAKKIKDWRPEAIELKKSGMKVARIADKLGMTRPLVSTYLNKPSTKAILQGTIQ